MREPEQTSIMSNEKRFAVILPHYYTEPENKKSFPTPTNEHEWKELLNKVYRLAKDYLFTNTQWKLFNNLREGNHEILKAKLKEFKKTKYRKKNLEDCLGSVFFWLDANPLSPAQEYMNDNIRSWFWSLIEKKAESYEEKVKWAIRTHQPQSLILDLLSSPECIEAINNEIKEERKYTMLHEACIHLNVEAMRLLLEKGGNINVYASTLGTPLDLVSERNHHEATSLLLNYSPSFETLLRALQYVPGHLDQIKMDLMDYLSKHYVNSDSAMEKEKEKILVLLGKYPSAFNTLLSSSNVYPCEGLKRILPDCPRTTVKLHVVNTWWRNLRFFDAQVLQENRSLLVLPYNISETPSELKRQRIG